MASTHKAGLHKKPLTTLKLPQRPAHAPLQLTDDDEAPPSRTAAGSDGLRELLSASLWPLVAAAFRDVDEHVEARFFQIADFQIVISRLPLRDSRESRDSPKRGGVDRRVTLEVWPAIGPRLLQVEWSGRRPYVVQRRDGDWLPRLIRASREFD